MNETTTSSASRSRRAFLVAGTNSGSGKTTVALGLMAAFHDRGMHVQPFKCGPDFIDPGLHRLITGRVSRNLDIWMSSAPFVRETFQRNSSADGISIIEGVMGMFDGGESSSGALAAFLGVPAVLVLDVRSMAESAAAIVHGFESLKPEGGPVGVILNRIGSPRHLQLVSDAIKSQCQAEILGYLPRSLDFSIPSRHLGLHTGEESPISPEALSTLSRTVSDHIDLDRLLELSSGNNCTQERASADVSAQTTAPRCRIGVARDHAFCFYYEDNLDLLRQAGAELVFFSPIHDRQLPPSLDGIYFGGGYPELYGQQLAENTEMLKAVRSWIENDHPVYAECGGFMYLTKGIVDHEGQCFELVGAFPVRATMKRSRASLGYREMTTAAPSCLGPAGTVVRGHEFHYSTVETPPESVPRLYQVNNQTTEGYCYKRVLGGYMHLHFGYSPQVAEAFVNYCLETKI